MYRLDREEFVQPNMIALWAVLGFQAGFVNAFGFLSCGRYVSHVTGIGTQVGIALASKNLLFAFELLGFPICFVLGSFINGVLTSSRIERKQKPRFDLIALIIPLGLFTLATIGKSGFFGVFGAELDQDFNELPLLFGLSFICGIQNGCFAVLTKGQIRTTHLTGISTDIGTDLARLFFGKLNSEERSLTKLVNFSRMVTFLAFSTGSICSVLISKKHGYSALLVPVMTSSSVYFVSKFVERMLDRKETWARKYG